MNCKITILLVLLLCVFLWSCESKSKNISQFKEYHELLFTKTNNDQRITKSHAKLVNNTIEIYYEISVPLNDTSVNQYINSIPDATYRAIKANPCGIKLLKSGVKFKGILIDNIDQTIYKEYTLDLNTFYKIRTENYEKSIVQNGSFLKQQIKYLNKTLPITDKKTDITITKIELKGTDELVYKSILGPKAKLIYDGEKEKDLILSIQKQQLLSNVEAKKTFKVIFDEGVKKIIYNYYDKNDHLVFSFDILSNDLE